MAKKKANILDKSLFMPYFSSVLSISFVLFMVGLAGALIANAKSISDYFKENITVSAILEVECDDSDAMHLAGEWEDLVFVKDLRVITQQEGVEEMNRILGEDFLDVFEVNPVPVSIDLRITADYISADSLAVVAQELSTYPEVEEVVYMQSLVDILNANIERIGIVVGVVVILLLFISVVLINNTVILNIFSQTELIRAQRLVGATKGFIAGPFATQAFFQGVISGALADILILCALYFVRNEFYQLFTIFDAVMLGSVMVAVIVLGVLICVISTVISVRSLIHP